MRMIGSILVAVGILWAADAFLNDGRYTNVILLGLKHVALSIGLHV